MKGTSLASLFLASLLGAVAAPIAEARSLEDFHGLYSSSSVVVTATSRLTYKGSMNFKVHPSGRAGVLSTSGFVANNGSFTTNMGNEFRMVANKFTVQKIAPPTQNDSAYGTMSFNNRTINANATASLVSGWFCTFKADLRKTRTRATLTTVYTVYNNGAFVYTITTRGIRLLHHGK